MDIIQTQLPFCGIEIHPGILENHLERQKKRIYTDIIEIFPTFINKIGSDENIEKIGYEYKFYTVEKWHDITNRSIDRRIDYQVSRTTIRDCLIFIKAQLLVFFEMIKQWIEEDKEERIKIIWNLVWIDYPELVYSNDTYQMSIKCSFYLVRNDSI